MHSQAPATFPILSQINLVHASPSHFLKINFNIILLSTPKFSKWPLSVRSPHQKSVWTSAVSNTCHMLSPSYSPWFDHPNTIWWGVHNTKLLIRQFSPLPVISSLVGPKYSPQHPILEYCKSTFLSQCERLCFTSIQNNIPIYILIFIFLDSKLEDKRFCTKW